jgi:hypothetical protein
VLFARHAGFEVLSYGSTVGYYGTPCVAVLQR